MRTSIRVFAQAVNEKGSPAPPTRIAAPRRHQQLLKNLVANKDVMNLIISTVQQVRPLSGVTQRSYHKSQVYPYCALEEPSGHIQIAANGSACFNLM